MEAKNNLEKLVGLLTEFSGVSYSTDVIDSIHKEVPLYDNTLKSIEQFIPYIEKVGEKLQDTVTAQNLIENFQERLDIIVHKLKFIRKENRNKVLLLQNTSPISSEQDSYLENLITLSGGVPIQLDSDNFHPDIILIVSSEPMGEILQNLPNVFTSGDWKSYNAVRNNQIFIIQKPEYLRSGGVYIPEDAEILAEIINPGYFIYGRDEDVWMNFSF